MCIVFGIASAQRGHYAGNSRPINGQRYQTDTPAQQNLDAQNQNGNQNVNRFDGGSNSIQQQPNNFQQQPSNFQQQPNGYQQPNVYQQPYQPAGFSDFGSGFPINQGFSQFPFAPFGFNGRR